MPLPKPKDNESQKEFISRCMSDDIMNKEYSDNEQRAGVCYTQWKEKKTDSMIRSDRAELKAVQLENGFLKAKISIARPGVFPYFVDGAFRNEAKLPEDLFSAFTVDSIKAGIPITDDHPEENGESVLVDSNNYQKFIKGNISNPRIENNEIVGDVLIYDADLIKRIMDKEQNEVSIGFVSQLEPENGFYGKDQYNIRQKNIMINHAAMVKHGRAGESIKIHIDRRQNMPKWIVEGKTSETLNYRRFDGKEDIQVSPEIFSELITIRTDVKEKNKEIETLKADKDELNKKIEQLKTDSGKSDEVKKLSGELETSQDSVKEWKKKYDELDKSIPERVASESAEKIKLMEFAKSADIKVDGLSNKEIKLQVIAKGLPFKEGTSFDTLSDDIINARFDAASELLKVRANETQTKQTVSVKVDANEIAKNKETRLNMYNKKEA
jgi:hypothetical protein